jgi:hypothetical protein
MNAVCIPAVVTVRILHTSTVSLRSSSPRGPPLWSSGQSFWLHNGYVLCFLWGTNCIYICYVEESRPPLWSSGQSSWLLNGDVLCFLWGTNWIYRCRPPLWSSGQSSWLQNGDVLSFLWGTNWIDVCYVEESRPPLWSSGQSSRLQIQRSGYDSGAARFSEKQWVWNEVITVSWVQLRSCLKEKVAFRKLDLFPSSGEWRETPTMLGPLERANSITGSEERKRVPISKRCFLVI